MSKANQDEETDTKETSSKIPVAICCAWAHCSNVDDRDNPTFKRCANCITKYCSRECQRLHWPEHRIACQFEPPEEVEAFRKILWKLANASALSYDFQVLTILKHGLHLLDDEALLKYRSKPVAMEVTLQYEPTHIKNFFRLFNTSGGKDTTGTTMSAIPQIVDIRVIDDDQLAGDANYAKMYRSTQSTNMVERTPDGLPIIVLLHFKQDLGPPMQGPRLDPHAHGSHQAGDVCFALTRSAMETARMGKDMILDVPIKIKGPWTTKRMHLNTENLMELMNAKIRKDATNDNEMHLRAKSLPAFEKHIICFASHGPALAALETSGPRWVNLLIGKIAREYIYHAAADVYGNPKSILPPPKFRGHVDN